MLGLWAISGGLNHIGQLQPWALLKAAGSRQPLSAAGAGDEVWPAAVPPADEQVHLQAGNREGPACHLSWCCLVVQAGMTSCSLHRSALGPLVSSTACGIRKWLSVASIESGNTALRPSSRQIGSVQKAAEGQGPGPMSRQQ